MAPLSAGELVATQRAAVARKRARDLARFGVAERDEIRTQGELDALRDWSRPPLLIGDGLFLLDSAPYDTGGYALELRDSTNASVLNCAAVIAVHDSAHLSAEGAETTVWAFDNAEVEVADGSCVFAFGRSTISADNARLVVADDNSRVTMTSFSEVIALNQASVVAQAGSLVVAAEDALVVLEEAAPDDSAVLGFQDDDYRPCCKVVIHGPAAVKVVPASRPCALFLADDAAQTDALEATAAWWDETLRLTEKERANFKGADPLVRLRERRQRIETLVRQIEAAPTFKANRSPRGRASGLVQLPHRVDVGHRRR
jgi:hypothetical protein